MVREDLTDEARRLLDAQYRLHAPQLFQIEVINNITRRVRKKELSRRDAVDRIGLFNAIPVSIHEDQLAIPAAVSLALTYGQALYDCIYLALAVRMQLRYLTADTRFVNGMQGSSLRKDILRLSDL